MKTSPHEHQEMFAFGRTGRILAVDAHFHSYRDIRAKLLKAGQLDGARDRESGIRAGDVTHSTTYFATEVARVNDFLQGVTVAKMRSLPPGSGGWCKAQKLAGYATCANRCASQVKLANFL